MPAPILHKLLTRLFLAAVTACAPTSVLPSSARSSLSYDIRASVSEYCEIQDTAQFPIASGYQITVRVECNTSRFELRLGVGSNATVSLVNASAQTNAFATFRGVSVGLQAPGAHQVTLYSSEAISSLEVLL